jgi:ATP-dependent DNA ligase
MIRAEQNIEVRNMLNFAAEWKRSVNFKQVEYNDFISKFENVSDSYFLEKIDGILGALTYVDGFASFSTVNDIKIDNLPLIDEYKYILQRRGDLRHVVLIGELVAVKRNVILPFPELIGVVKTSRLEINKPLIHHYIYDIFSIDGKRSTSYKDSMQFILQNFQGASKIHIPKYVHGGIEDFKHLYAKSVTKEGIEGIVARLRDGKRNYKIKSSTTWDVALLGIGDKTMKSWSREQAPYLVTAFMGPDGTFRRTSDVGTGFSMKEREDFFNYVMHNKVQEIGEEVFVPPEKVIEVRASRWRPKQSPAYLWTGREYKLVGKKASVSLDMPSFLRSREDKSVNDYDVRLTQIEVS